MLKKIDADVVSEVKAQVQRSFEYERTEKDRLAQRAIDNAVELEKELSEAGFYSVVHTEVNGRQRVVIKFIDDSSSNKMEIEFNTHNVWTTVYDTFHKKPNGTSENISLENLRQRIKNNFEECYKYYYKEGIK
jgi:hypothetical protein